MVTWAMLAQILLNHRTSEKKTCEKVGGLVKRLVDWWKSWWTGEKVGGLVKKLVDWWNSKWTAPKKKRLKADFLMIIAGLWLYMELWTLTQLLRAVVRWPQRHNIIMTASFVMWPLAPSCSNRVRFHNSIYGHRPLWSWRQSPFKCKPR